jgi:ribonuclease HII
MKRAFEDMLNRAAQKQPLVLGEINAIVDGKFAPDINVPCTAMVKADAQIPQVMAASILAKTERDKHMEEMAKLYSQYGYEKHKGYPTKAHREAILKHGPSPIQRLSFRVGR